MTLESFPQFQANTDTNTCLLDVFKYKYKNVFVPNGAGDIVKWSFLRLYLSVRGMYVIASSVFVQLR